MKKVYMYLGREIFFMAGDLWLPIEMPKCLGYCFYCQRFWYQIFRFSTSSNSPILCGLQWGLFYSLIQFDNNYPEFGASLVAQMVKRLPTMQETRVLSLGREDPLEKEMATHSSILAWRISWMEEPGGLQSMGLQRVGHDWETSLSLSLCIWVK